MLIVSKHLFTLEYDDKYQTVTITNIAGVDGYTCSVDFLFNRSIDKKDLKTAITQIIQQKSKPADKRGERDLTPVEVKADIAATAALQTEIDTLKAEIDKLKEPKS